MAAIASDQPFVVSAHTSVAEAAAIMLNNEIRHLLVAFDNGASPGLVSLRVVMAVLLQSASPAAWLTTLRISFMPPPDVPQL